MTSRDHVLIVGGGIAGLVLAAALDPGRHHVTIVEERPERAGGGTVLALWRRAIADLERIGVPARSLGFGVGSGVLRDHTGRVLVRHEVPDLTFVPRPELVAGLEERLPKGVTRLTREVTDPAGLAAELGADLVVGADGVRSVCRRTAFAPAEPVVTDWVVLRGHLERELDETGEWWGRDGMFGTTPGPWGTAWFCAVRGPGPAGVVDLGSSLERAVATFAGWDPRVGEVLRAAGRHADVQRMLLAPSLRWPVADDLVLIGDAAHGMAPNLGRGANEAIRDAVVLADLLRRRGTKGAAAPFARRRHATTQALRLGSSAVLWAATSGWAARVPRPVTRMARA